MALAQNHTRRPTEYSKRPRNKPTQLQSSDFSQRCQKSTLEKGQPLQQVVLGKPDTHMQKAAPRSLSLTLYKINSKWIVDLNVRPNVKLQNY
jgi:hypothetical protein